VELEAAAAAGLPDPEDKLMKPSFGGFIFDGFRTNIMSGSGKKQTFY
jgi:hypothetical protein